MNYLFNDPEKLDNDPNKSVKSLRANLILDLMLVRPSITIAELSVILDYAESTIKRDIRNLKEIGKLEYTGSAKNGKWIVK